MKVLAVVIAHPLRKVAGATIAGRALSLEVGKLVDLELAIMWDRDERFSQEGTVVQHVESTNPLQAGARWLPRSALVPLYGSRIPEMIRNGRYDLVHLHNLLPAFAAERAAAACRAKGVPYVISSHGFNEQSRYAALNGFRGIKKALASLAIERPFRRVVKGADAIFALSDREGDLLAALGVPAERIHVVTNGVNEFYLDAPSVEELAAVRVKFSIGGEHPVLLFMGSLHGYKGLDIFLRSLGDLRRPVQAVVAGQFKTDDERRTVLRQSGLPLALAEAVVFTNAVSDAELRALYCLADLFVYPTKGDSLPLVVLEAMASGLPVVSTTVAGVPFMVGPEQGILVEPDNAAAVTDAVSRLLEDEPRRRAMGRSARATVLERFRWTTAAERAVAAYEKVLGARAAVAAAARG